MAFMEDRSKRLVKYGFIKPSAKNKYKFDENKKHYVPVNPGADYDPKDADEEIHEQMAVMPSFMGHSNYLPSGYPAPSKQYRLVYKSPSASLEETYYWIIDHYKTDYGFPIYKKVVDIFSASEQSAFWGQAQSRLGIQQDRATQYMATIGKMVKDLFQLVRELRILEERMDIYEKAPKSKSADVTLKGLYIDMVEGGSKNPSSVYGIAQQVGFTILPDLFFNTHVYSQSQVDEKVNSMQWNEQVKNILRRKLYSYITWKEKTESELKSRFTFTTRYLRQHWGVIKMYMTWVKPYLKNVQRLRMKEAHMESEEMISAFETSMTEIEIIITKPPQKKGIRPVILFSMMYTTQPEMSYTQEGYQHRGPLHVGQVEFQMRSYGWTDRDIENFTKMKREEDMELIKLIDESVAAAMDSLGDELRRYLDEANETLHRYGMGESSEEKKKSKAAQMTGDIFSPFAAVFGGFKDMFSMFSFNLSSSSSKSPEPSKKEKDEVAEDKLLQVAMWQTYKNYKKAHGMIAW